MQPNQNTDLLLKPHVPNHVANVPDTKQAERKLYMCVKQCRCTTDCKDTICATCRNPMCYEVKFAVSPMSMISGVAQLNKFNVRDFGALEERMAEFGINGSKAALTAVFLSKQEVKVDFIAGGDLSQL
uniref:Uncharacterized protein n=1 Tax=Populus alba TaxID=43335 RepID=A0A4U5R274_POPAL|nr:hypothetical protein D5086_0000010790 [Populus alba]